MQENWRKTAKWAINRSAGLMDLVSWPKPFQLCIEFHKGDGDHPTSDKTQVPLFLSWPLANTSWISIHTLYSFQGLWWPHRYITQCILTYLQAGSCQEDMALAWKLLLRNNAPPSPLAEERFWHLLYRSSQVHMVLRELGYLSHHNTGYMRKHKNFG